MNKKRERRNKKMKNIFDTRVAKVVGVNAAVIFENFAYWVDYNRENNINFYDNYYWTFNSIPSIKKGFDYLSKSKSNSL